MQDELQKQVAADLGISSVPADQQQQLIAQFGEIALKAATMSVMNKLTQDKRNEFMKLAEAGDAAATQAFLDKEVPEHEDLAKKAIADEITRFKQFSAA